VQHSNVTSMQILLMGPDRATADIDVVPNPLGSSPQGFDDPSHGIRIPRLGAKSLIQVAGLAVQDGYRLIGFELLGAGGQLMRDEDEQSRVSHRLVEAIGAGDEASVKEGLALMAHDFVFYEVVGVELYQDGLVTVRRNGVLFTSAPKQILGFLRTHWKDVVR